MSELKKEIIENGIHYTLVGDYYFPDFAGSDEIGFQGKWAELHKQYLKAEKPDVYAELLFTNRMKGYLKEFNSQAEERFRSIMDDLKTSAGINESLKAQNQMMWIQKVKAIAKSAEEIVLNEMIYC